MRDPLLRGGAAFVYSASTVNTIGYIKNGLKVIKKTTWRQGSVEHIEELRAFSEIHRCIFGRVRQGNKETMEGEGLVSACAP